MSTRREKLPPAAAVTGFRGPVVATGPAAAELITNPAGTVDPVARQAAYDADVAANRAAHDSARIAEAAAAQQDAAQRVAAAIRQLERQYDVASLRAAAADAKANMLHTEWERAYRAARDGGVSAGVLLTGVDRRNVHRAVVAPD